MTITGIAPDAGTLSADVIGGLTALAAFIETHPDLPLDRHGDPLHLSVRHGTDEENRAEVDRIAAVLGVDAGYMRGSERTHYRAQRDFGGGVAYSATAITHAWMERSRAADSYQGSVQPEGPVAA